MRTGFRDDASGYQTVATRRQNAGRCSCRGRPYRARAQRSRHHSESSRRPNGSEGGAMIDAPDLEGSEIMVPGSIANLGPGLDTLAVAVQIYLRVRVASVSPSRRGSIEFHFETELPEQENRIETAFRQLARNDTDFPSMRLEVNS